MTQNSTFKSFFTVLMAIVIISGGACGLSKLSDESGSIEKPASPQIIGGDKDEHGCLIPAGYSWCEPKQKCLRLWEESCYEADEKLLQAVLAKEYKKSVSQVKVTIAEDDGTHASGGVRFEAEGEGGAFLAVKQDTQWKIVYSGNGSINCDELEKYNFPESMLSSFCD